jgi:hypothetical protein
MPIFRESASSPPGQEKTIYGHKLDCNSGSILIQATKNECVMTCLQSCKKTFHIQPCELVTCPKYQIEPHQTCLANTDQHCSYTKGLMILSWMHMKIYQFDTWRQECFARNFSNTIRAGKNSLSNRINSLNNKISLVCFNLNSYIVSCKTLFITFRN